MDLKIFVLTPDDIRLARRISRDIADRGRTVVDVLAQYCRFVKPAYDDFIKPTMKYADVIIPFSTENANAVNMLCQNLSIKLQIARRHKGARKRTISDHVDEASRALGKLNLTKEEKLAETQPYSDTLPFELVDIQVDYGSYRDELTVYPPGSRQNFKISSILMHLLTILQQCMQVSEGQSTEGLNSSYLFK